MGSQLYPGTGRGREKAQVWEGRCGQGEVSAQLLPLARLSILTQSPKPQGQNVAGCPMPSAMTS